MPLTRLALACIRLYQRHLSPHKGFSCAYRCRTGRASCSELGYRAVRQRGVIGGFGVLRLRLARCGQAHRAGHPTARFIPARQRGSCDAPCDIPCDGTECGKGSNLCSVCDCGSCDFGRDDKRKRDKR
jgi:putative component of membrane protein insertase Oxa1/YidC/SpoIIIJ protein YidD